MDYKKEVLERTSVEITTEWNGGSYDMEVGTEDTADGYTLYYIKESNAPLFIQEHVYYNEDSLREAVQKHIYLVWASKILFWDEDLLELIDWEEVYDTLEQGH